MIASEVSKSVPACPQETAALINGSASATGDTFGSCRERYGARKPAVLNDRAAPAPAAQC